MDCAGCWEPIDSGAEIYDGGCVYACTNATHQHEYFCSQSCHDDTMERRYSVGLSDYYGAN